ncbi:MAG: hypothetical protein NTV43_13500 [Methylococcales bacterium]|nr:hypothetical protein [Methylococcales bacterium]
MKSDKIVLIRIDAKNRVCITPEKADFTHIYRAAMAVQWDLNGKFLYSSVPQEWSHIQWFKQIITAASDEYGCQLVITENTIWENVDDTTKEEMCKFANLNTPSA